MTHKKPMDQGSIELHLFEKSAELADVDKQVNKKSSFSSVILMVVSVNCSMVSSSGFGESERLTSRNSLALSACFRADENEEEVK